MRTKTKRVLKARVTGDCIESGESVNVSKHPAVDYILTVRTDDGRRVSFSAVKAHSTLDGFMKEPSMKTLKKWVNDSVCKSLRGKNVEPDGYDSEGFPSWLLVLNLI